MLSFHNINTLALGLPPGACAGIRMQMIIEAWEKTGAGGILTAEHDVAYQTNGRVLRNEMTNGHEESVLDFIVEAGDDTAIHVIFQSDVALEGGVSPFSETLNRAERRWHEWFNNAPRVTDDLQLKYYLAW